MNAAMKIILRQLGNEGVYYTEKFGMHWLSIGRCGLGGFLGEDPDFGSAVNDALKGSIKITALLSKLQDALEAESEGTLADLLITDDMVRGKPHESV